MQMKTSSFLSLYPMQNEHNYRMQMKIIQYKWKFIAFKWKPSNENEIYYSKKV